MLVPLSAAQSDLGSDESTLTPGAVTSGLSCSEYGVGPTDEKDAISSATLWRPLPEAAAVIASGASPGDPTVPLLLPSLPAAMHGTTPAFAAPSIALTTMSRDGSISGSPSERLITSMPSATAWSIAFASSGAFPSSPQHELGTASAL